MSAMTAGFSEFVPFRVQKWGWVIPAYCFGFGVWLFGWRLGLPTGALLLASVLLHEVGHMLAATALEVPVHEFGLCLMGAYNRRAFASRRRDEFLISCAGPVMNILLIVPALFLPHIGAELALCNLMLGLVNLLPLPSGDGLRMLQALMGPSRRGVAAVPAVVQPEVG